MNGFTALWVCVIVVGQLATGAACAWLLRGCAGCRAGASSAATRTWLPLLLVAPLVALALCSGRRFDAVHAAAWSGALPAALMALGFGLLRASRSEAQTREIVADEQTREATRLLSMSGLAATGAGLVLLLVAMIGQLHVIVGQLCFALGGVMLWMASPARMNSEPSESSQLGASSEQREKLASAGARWRTVAILAALLSLGGIFGLGMLGPGARAASAPWIMLGVAAATILPALAARTDESLALSGWMLGYGILFAVGASSTIRLLPARLAESLGVPPMLDENGMVSLAITTGLQPLVAAGVLALAVGLTIVAHAALVPRAEASPATGDAIGAKLGLRVVGVAAIAASVLLLVRAW